VDSGSIPGLIVAALGGAVIGLEREWSGHAAGPDRRFGGIRTFTLLGGLAGLAGGLAASGFLAVAVVLLCAAAALIVVGYVAASHRDVDATTEVAAVVVLASGTLAGAGSYVLASAVIAATALLLVEKTRLHTLVGRIDDVSLRASLRFAAMACIILPLLPSGPYGPYDAVRPRELWALVLFFSGLAFLGWIARRLVGAHHGAIVAGLLGGIISSTSVTLRFAQDSRRQDAPRGALGAGAVAACTVMLLRVTAVCALLNPAMAALLPRYLAVAFLTGAAVVLFVWQARPRAATPEITAESPLQLRAALQMTALFQVVLFVIFAVRARWGAGALVATSAFVGLTDLDALTLSLARSTAASGDVHPATIALVAGVLANTLLKLVVALVVGRGAFRLVTVGVLGAMAVSLGAVFLFDSAF
jgi:uncharacterized membrane protein (DUF4010 family)